jgi:hypothetical protein
VEELDYCPTIRLPLTQEIENDSLISKTSIRKDGEDGLMHQYEHTQVGTLMRSVFGSCALISGGMGIRAICREASSGYIPVVIALVFVLCLFCFHALAVRVSREEIALRFGIGLIRKRFTVSEVQDAAIVRNHWYYGWGIKLTPHGWLYNVSGFDALEIQLKNGHKYRIGTDEPDALLAAVECACASSS